jgi:lipopolysaccharide export system permease protein
MKTVRRLLYRDIGGSIAFVTVAFLSLFFFIDFVDELDDVGKQGYTAAHAFAWCLLQAPGHFYELFPITVLIGTIFSLARFAQSTEWTILRTGGLGPQRALQLLAALGLGFAVLTFVVGDYIAPALGQQAVLLHARFRGGLDLGRNGAWLKDKRMTPQGEVDESVNVGHAAPDGSLAAIRIFEFDPQGRLIRRVQAATGVVERNDTWQLSDVHITDWPTQPTDTARVAEQTLPRYAWPSTLNAGVVTAALLPAETMSTLDLYRYATHLSQHEQAAQRYAIEFWKKAFYPFACLVMMALALPFAYLHARAGGVSFKVFGGILLGISFVLLNNVAGHLGMLHGWSPLLVAATPSALYLLMSLAAFWWLVRYR